MILFEFRWFFDQVSFSNFRTRYSSQARSPRLLSSSSLNIFWVLSTRIMGRVDSVERNLEKRVFSTNFLVFFRERSRWERKRWYQLIWTYHMLILYNSHISMMLMTMHHMDWVIILMMSMDFVVLSTDHGFLDLGLGRDVFGDIDGTKSFRRVISCALCIAMFRWCWWWSNIWTEWGVYEYGQTLWRRGVVLCETCFGVHVVLVGDVIINTDQ